MTEHCACTKTLPAVGPDKPSFLGIVTGGALVKVHSYAFQIQQLWVRMLVLAVYLSGKMMHRMRRRGSAGVLSLGSHAYPLCDSLAPVAQPSPLPVWTMPGWPGKRRRPLRGEPHSHTLVLVWRVVVEIACTAPQDTGGRTESWLGMRYRRPPLLHNGKHFLGARNHASFRYRHQARPECQRISHSRTARQCKELSHHRKERPSPISGVLAKR
jgi:hypothetical protein